MKKLIFAVALICATAISQAASVSWQVKLSSATKILDKNGASWTATGTANSGQTMYLVLASDTSTFVDHLKAGTLAGTDYLDTATSFTAATGAMSSLKASPNDAKITTAAQDFNVIIVYTDGDGKNWYQVSSETASSNARAAEGDVANVVFNTGVVFANTSSNWTAVAAPEPTSAMLLILGVAGLALKRKRA